MDANISEIIVILDKSYEDKLQEAVKMLKDTGMSIESTDDQNSVVEGEIDSSRLCDVQNLPCVDYVRRVFSYNANFPPGDPRDRDGV